MANNLNSAAIGLTTELKTYLNIRLNLLGLQISKRISALTSVLLTMIIMLFIAAMFLVMLSLALAWWLGSLLGSFPLALLIVAALYALLGVVVYAGRKRLFMEPIARKLNNTMAGGELHETDIPISMRFSSIDDQILFMTKEVEKSELMLQNSYKNLTEELEPINLAKNMLGVVFNSPAITVSLLEMAIRLLRSKRKSRKEKQDEE